MVRIQSPFAVFVVVPLCGLLLAGCPDTTTTAPADAGDLADDSGVSGVPDAGGSGASDAGLVEDGGRDEPDDGGRREPDAGSLGPGDAGGNAGADEENTTATCTDGIDNDNDTYFDCADFDCDDVAPCNLSEDTEETCSDGLDNDADTYVDCVDFGCDDVWFCDVPEVTNAFCLDGVDNDRDGQIDCLDDDCAAASVCGTTEADNAACSDGVDNDNDTYFDCADFDCDAASVCSPDENSAEACADGVDNDGDTYFDCDDFGCADFPICDAVTVRVGSWNVNDIGAPGSAQYQAVVDILNRVVADVMCLQEVDDDEAANLISLGVDVDMPYTFQGNVSAALAGGLTNACLSRYPLSVAVSHHSASLSSDGDANDMGRDVVLARIEPIPGTGGLSVLNVHLKSGFDDTDYYRKQVEALRTAALVDDHAAMYPDDGIVVLGDFNEFVFNPDLGDLTFAQPPPGLPQSFSTGSDVVFPVVYNPFAPFTAQRAFTVADVTWEDDPGEYATRIPSGRRIDYVLFRDVESTGDEVYEACADDGMDGNPPGYYIAKAGAPLVCGTNDTASDHRPVLVDFFITP